MENFILRVKKFIVFLTIIGLIVGGGYFVYEYTDIFKTSYTITLDGNGTVIPNNEISVNDDGTVTLPTPVRKGYTFDGWYLGEEKFEDSIIITSNETLTAHWIPNKHEISFVIDGKTETKEFNYDSIPTTDTPVKACNEVGWEYKFVDWEPKLEKVSEDTTYTAIFEKVKQKRTLDITCNKDIGTFSCAGEYDYGTDVNISTHDVKGYIFDGWYIDNILYTAEKQFTITLIENITVEARYSLSTATITYLNTKSASNENVTSYKIEDGIIELKDLNTTGYDFLGWYTSPNGKGEKVTSIDASKFENLILYAHFNAHKFYVTLSQNKINAGTISADKEYYEYLDIVTLTATANNGYTFDGWYNSNDEKIGSSEITMFNITDNIEIKAKYSCIQYTINYHNTKSATNINKTIFTVEDESFSLSNLSARGYTFNGWYTASSGGEKVTSIDTSITKNHILYARFSAIPYTISYTLNGGSLPSYYPNSYTIESNTFTLVNPTRQDYEFIGWTTYSDPNPKLTITIEHGSTGSRLYIANWRSTVLFNINYIVDNTTLLKETSYAENTISAPNINANDYGMTGYNLNGWYLDANCTQKYTFNKMPTKDLTLYGKWEYMLGEGFVEFIDEFEEYSSSYIEINSYYEFVSLMEYVRFYAIQDRVYFNVVYTSPSSTLTNQAFLESAFGGFCSYTYNHNYIDLQTDSEIITMNNTGNFLNADPYKNEIYNQQDYAFAVNNNVDRNSSNTEFNINKVKNSLEVHTSDQLVYALEKGFYPLCVSGSPAENMYKKAQSILNNICDDEMTDLEKARAIYEWLILNVDYDHGALDVAVWGKYDAWHLEGIFNNKKGVCDAISKAMVVLCKIENIPIIRVTGSQHAWNKIYINNTWYGIDATHGDIGLSNQITALTYTSFLFTDSYKESKNCYTETYDDPNYIDINCNTPFNFYDYAEFTYQGTNIDLEISNVDELKVLFKYYASLNLPINTSCITFEFTFSDNYSLTKEDFNACFINAGINNISYGVASMSNTLGKNSYLVLIYK